MWPKSPRKNAIKKSERLRWDIHFATSSFCFWDIANCHPYFLSQAQKSSRNWRFKSICVCVCICFCTNICICFCTNYCICIVVGWTTLVFEQTLHQRKEGQSGSMALGLAPGCCTLLIWEYKYYSVNQNKSGNINKNPICEYKYYSQWDWAPSLEAEATPSVSKVPPKWPPARSWSPEAHIRWMPAPILSSCPSALSIQSETEENRA